MKLLKKVNVIIFTRRILLFGGLFESYEKNLLIFTYEETKSQLANNNMTDKDMLYKIILFLH